MAVFRSRSTPIARIASAAPAAAAAPAAMAQDAVGLEEVLVTATRETARHPISENPEWALL